MDISSHLPFLKSHFILYTLNTNTVQPNNMDEIVKPVLPPRNEKQPLYQSDRDKPIFRNVGTTPMTEPGSFSKSQKELKELEAIPDSLLLSKQAQQQATQPNVQELNGVTFIGAEKRGLPASEQSMRAQAIRKVGLNQIMVAGHPPYSGRLWP
jgi:hypothetical protein